MTLFQPRRNRNGGLAYVSALAALSGAPDEVVYDGDGLRGLFDGAQAMRFLGCDTPEVAYRVPTGPDASKGGQKLGSDLWAEYLDDPFADGRWPDFNGALSPLVEEHLARIAGPDCAANHARHAERARDALIEIIEQDRQDLGIPPEAFRLFVALAHEVFDSYGRLLCFVNSWVEDADRRPPLYNERMIANGMAAPFFIWPNVDPFRGRPTVSEAALSPRELRSASRRGSLGRTRTEARAARAAGAGIHDPSDPLRLLPYELRVLGDRKVPSRWVIDLGAEDDDPTLLPPEGYMLVAALEDRLFVPAEYVPLFVQKGWQPARLVRLPGG